MAGTTAWWKKFAAVHSMKPACEVARRVGETFILLLSIFIFTYIVVYICSSTSYYIYTLCTQKKSTFELLSMQSIANLQVVQLFHHSCHHSQ